MEDNQVLRRQIKVWDSYDPDEAKHVLKLKEVLDNDPKTHGWQIYSFDETAKEVTIVKIPSQMKVQTIGTTKTIDLPQLFRKPSEGERAAAQLEKDYQGYVMTSFEPHLGKAELSKLTANELRARNAVATAMGLKPWDIKVKAKQGGGFAFKLPNAYSPSKHDNKLQEVAEAVVGKFGWYWTADAKALTGEIVPAEPATFPAAFPITDKDFQGRLDPHVTPYGYILPPHGDDPYKPITINWKNGIGVLCSGLAGAGKTVCINAIIAHQLSVGGKVAIIDDADKSVDFEWCKDMIGENWWGCDNKTSALAVMSLVAEEGDRRAKILKENGVQNWFELEEKNPKLAFPPILVVMDEVQMMLKPPKKLAGLPKEHPMRLQNEKEIAETSMLYHKTSQVLAKYRFVGIRVLLATQVASQSTGLGPEIRSKLGFKMLLGTNPAKSQMSQSFAVPESMPILPSNVKGDKVASRGAGFFEFEGAGNGIFKACFATGEDLRKMLVRNCKSKLTKNANPEPTQKQIARYEIDLSEE